MWSSAVQRLRRLSSKPVRMPRERRIGLWVFPLPLVTGFCMVMHNKVVWFKCTLMFLTFIYYFFFYFAIQCYYIGATSDAATKIVNEVSKPLSHHVPVVKICEKLKKKDSQICELKYGMLSCFFTNQYWLSAQQWDCSYAHVTRLCPKCLYMHGVNVIVVVVT